jgi:hypothetical protein
MTTVDNVKRATEGKKDSITFDKSHHKITHLFVIIGLVKCMSEARLAKPRAMSSSSMTRAFRRSWASCIFT